MRRYFAATCLLLAALLAVTILVPSTARANEVILDFRSDITVHEDSTMTVRETITVRAENRQIKRGIYREFPTRYNDSLGNRYVVDFRVLEVLRDGEPEPYHLRRRSNGVAVYIGQEDVIIPPGVYAYTIAYKTSRQLGYFDDHDELYWNVTGNGWIFPIESVHATVTLPPGVPPDGLEAYGYTGAQGATGDDYTSSVDSAGLCYFATTRTLRSYEGLTIVVEFPKGFVTVPSGFTRLMWLLRDNAALLIALIGLILLIAYYWKAWAIVGRDLPRGTIIPLFEPPTGFSPAAVRFLRRMGFDHKVLAAAMINMAVKGYVKIDEGKKRKYTITRLRNDVDDLSGEEIQLLDKLLPAAGASIVLEKDNASTLQRGVLAVTKFLDKKLRKHYYVLNAGVFSIGLVFAIVVNAVAFFIMISAGSVSLFVIPFGFAYVVVLALFGHLLKAWTPAGREVLDKIEGFRMYLSVAEQERLEMLNPPERTPELFEMFLPYALALDVEQKWSEQFADVFARMSAEGREYRPVWYSGGSWRGLAASRFAHTMGSSFTTAISSSANPPGSSSGSGGSSGGGGGGGGGGGW